MKKFFRVLLFLVVFVGISMFVIPEGESAYANDTLYFDDDGNLVFVVYNKKASSSVRYRTVGWVIKKYDEPISAAGQVSAVLVTPKYYYEVEDNNNPGYMYNYFIMERAEVQGAIRGISPNWENYLEKYGGTVYLDSVMTVTHDGVPQGGLNADGSGWGEVYYDYAGISTARYWARPGDLQGYFDIPAGFPALSRPPSITYGEDTATDINISGSILASAELGSHEISAQEYDIKNGIPSGEDLYLYGTVQEYYSEGRLKRHTGLVNVPVMVTTDYVLSWTDTRGTPRRETNRVERWYTVPLSYDYYTVDFFDTYRLSGIQTESSAIEPFSGELEAEDRLVGITRYGARENHIKVTQGSCYAGSVTINSTNYLKPDIPDEDQFALATGGGADVSARSDSLSVDGKCIISGAWAKQPVLEEVPASESISVYRTGLMIGEKTQNGVYNDCMAVFYYKCGDKLKRVEAPAGELKVHTPVVCGASLSSPKRYNMLLQPGANQIILGTDFSVRAASVGRHRSIKGYGYRDYSGYVKKRFVRFPFRVRINNKEYRENTWLECGGSGFICYLPKETAVGDYNIEVAVLAKNAPVDSPDSAAAGMLGDGANMDIGQYGAVQTIAAEAAGTMYGVRIENEDGAYYVGNKTGFYKKAPDNARQLPAEAVSGKNCELALESNGLGSGSGDSIRAEVSYYHVRDGVREEVMLYCTGKHDIMGGGEPTPAPSYVEWTESGKTELSENVYEWKTTLELGESLLAMPQGVFPSDDEIINKYAIRDGNILINLQIYGCCGKVPVYSYINVENSRRGYCNMWKTEGCAYEFVDSTGEAISLEYGDSAVLTLSGKLYGDYEIVGTH